MGTKKSASKPPPPKLATPVWDRVIEEATRLAEEEQYHGSPLMWLRAKMEEAGVTITKGRMSNWGNGGRDVPDRSAVREAIATALGRDRVWVDTGVDVPDRTSRPARPAPITPQQLLATLSKLSPEQLAAASQFVQTLAAASHAPSSAPQIQRRTRQVPMLIQNLRRSNDNVIQWIPSEFLSVGKKR